MKRNVVYFSPEDSIFKVVRAFVHFGISGAPVVEEGKVVGIISESDILKFLSLEFPKEKGRILHEPHALSLFLLEIVKDHITLKRNIKKISKLKVKDFMRKKIIYISPEATVAEAANLMLKHKVNRLPVIANNRLVGIITRSDLLKAIAD